MSAVAFSHDSRTVVAADHIKGMIRLFDTETGKELTQCVIADSPGEPMCLAVSPDGKLLAVSADSTVTLLRMDRLLEMKDAR